ncbi:hypothetical protein GCM10011371_03600 [Novosphingobium marinum]|uniref:Metal-dependent hydrolase n=1 Tax=Novosphingobium marinum TaxID=1514948 RepID=A0A7Y9XT79_9SPHN|nr:metal-dependent hydrolase [Novosphingobium marinum]NYH94052.1 hypothetical protein [Novosphingobium marinum]GGC19221.1 hypothetical protein GCM10011371_03600 [Novosphingobium marinum]
MLTVRKPELDQRSTPLVWSRVPEFALYNNGSSICIPYYEHFLNNVAKEVRDEHCGSRPELRETLDLFIRQEATHARYHTDFNRRLLGDDNPELEAIVAELVEDLRKLRKNRSLAFNMAFCAGFENTATFSALYLFQHCDDLFEGADARGANLFLWHVAEEFEHRSVCHDAFHAISGNWLVRVSALAYSFWHVGHYFDRAAAVVLRQWRETLSEEERSASVQRERMLKRRQMRFILPRLRHLVMPGFDPASFEVPPKIAAALDHFAGEEPIHRHFNQTWDERTA